MGFIRMVFLYFLGLPSTIGYNCLDCISIQAIALTELGRLCECTPDKENRCLLAGFMLILIGIAIGVILAVSVMKYINLYGYPSLPQILLFTAIAIGLLLSLLYIGFLLVFSQLDPMRFRLTNQCTIKRHDQFCNHL